MNRGVFSHIMCVRSCAVVNKRRLPQSQGGRILRKCHVAVEAIGPCVCDLSKLAVIAPRTDGDNFLLMSILYRFRPFSPLSSGSLQGPQGGR